MPRETLVLENERIRREFRWNGGNLVTTAVTDLRTGRVWTARGVTPDVQFPGETDAATDGAVRETDVPANAVVPAHRRVEVSFRLGALEVRRVFKLFPGCPAIATELFLRGRARQTAWRSAAAVAGQLVNVENQHAATDAGFHAPVLDRLEFGPRRHLRVTAVRFCDITDRRNNLVHEERLAPYGAPARLTGNLLFGADTLDAGAGFFLLKEAPSSDVQLAPPGSDFAVTRAAAEITGIGVDPDDLPEQEWVRAYGCVLGVAEGRESAILEALRRYQETLRRYDPARDAQILVNTWGDRNRDARVGEAFALKELECCKRLGATHFMIDDGWQAGTSSNSATAGGSMENIWKDEAYWKPHPRRFPNGLTPLSARARELGLRLGLWFAPAKDNHYENWRRDADTLVGLHREHGINLFKIDMVDLPVKTAETRFRRFMETVLEATRGQVSFNLDVTAQRRGGFHLFREFGSLFLENRYTDWSNYYPHWTLRNLWMLSRYVAPRFLQIEFLNRWRNAANYAADDPLAPGCVPFDYCFAVTMMAQPLAWFEASGLPEEAFAIAPLVAKARELETELHAPQVFPIGDEPSGAGWTGFQTRPDDARPGAGLLLVFREFNQEPRGRVKLWDVPPGTRLAGAALAGAATDFTGTVNADGTLDVTLPAPFTFGLWRLRPSHP